ncbi:MAG: putative lipopolysaccharide heptosyltransferase III [Chthoniobacterales bacterium]
MNILLIQLKRIGDLILTTPAIGAVRQQFPHASITLVVSPACEELLPAITGVDRTLVVRGTATDVLPWFAILLRRFDYCFDFTRTDRSAFLTFLSHAQKRITADHVKLRSKIRARSYSQLVPCSVRLLHTIDYHLALLAPLGVDDVQPDICLHLPEVARRNAENLLAATGLEGEFIVIHPGSARPEKFWKAGRWGEVINHFALERGLKCVLTGGPSAREQAHIADIKRCITSEVADLSGRTDLLTLAAIVARSSLLATVDSAPMHFAAACGTPQVVLFGPTNPFQWRPQASPAIILQGDSGGPVTAFNPKLAAVSMNQISTAAVINAMEALLSAPAAPVL